MTRLDMAPLGGTSLPASEPVPRKRLSRNTWTRREGSTATITVSCSHSRYAQGEIVVQAVYRLTDGRRDPDPSHRIYIGNPTERVIDAYWELLFDEVARAQQFGTQSVSIRFRDAGFPDLWAARLRALAQVIARELKVILRGTARDSARGRE